MKDNIFNISGDEGKMIKTFYNLLIKGNMVTYYDLLVTFDEGKDFLYRPTKHKYYGCAKKAINKVREVFCSSGLVIDEIPLDGRTNGFIYRGANKNPLWQIYHKSILEERFKTLSSKCGICSFPLVYWPFTGKRREIVFHPHRMIEYNGRLFAIGAEEREGFPVRRRSVIAMDRIKGEIGTPFKPCNHDHPFIHEFSGEYDYLMNLVGVSLPKDAELTTIRLRAHNEYMFGLIRTKPIHSSQRTIIFPDWKEGRKYGEFEIQVYPNKELLGVIRYYGADLEVVTPIFIRNMLYEEFCKSTSIYTKK